MINIKRLTLSVSAATLLAWTAFQANSQAAQPPIVDTSAKPWLQTAPATPHEPKHVVGRQASIKHHRRRQANKHRQVAAPPTNPPRHIPS
ncbi:hypothetical protein [Sphingomonas oryzagri]